ncbi:MAG: hypothetical protein PHQ23_07990, partial [Candidatus Wallbacteria bacterium]|nr:hypothetical protein [Candidatus Wallbacteria bacterium]
ITEYAKIISFPNADTHYTMVARVESAGIEKALGEYDRAIARYSAILQDYLSSTYYLAYTAVGSSYIGLGDCLYAKGECETALDKYRGVENNTSLQSYLLDSRLGQGRTLTALKQYSEAHRMFAWVVDTYHEQSWYYDESVITGKKGAEQVLYIKIDPMIDTIAQGESKTFTASIVYPNDTLASVPAAAATDWQWTCSGNEADGHAFSFEGNTSTYKGGSGDFMDTIITARCKVDAGSYGAKGRNKAVEPYIWIEGDNQVPICLVNEDGRRIKFAPIYEPWDGSHRGWPPPVTTPAPMTVQFATPYTVDEVDQFNFSFWGMNHTHETETIYTETETDSRIFFSPDRKTTIEIVSPLPVTRSAAMTNSFPRGVPGENMLKFNFSYSGEVIALELPIWLGPGYGTDETRVDMYEASNQVINEADCANLNPEDYATKNTKMYIKVVDPGLREQTTTAEFISSGFRRRFILIKSGNCYFSNPLIVVKTDSTVGEKFVFRGDECDACRVNPDSDLGSQEVTLTCIDSAGKEQKSYKPVKKPALIVCALQTSEYSGPPPIIHYFGSSPARSTMVDDVLEETVKLMQDIYALDVIFNADKSYFMYTTKNHIKPAEYEMIYLTAHGDGVIDYGSWFETLQAPQYLNISTSIMVFPYDIKDLYAADNPGKDSPIVILNCCKLGNEKFIDSWIESCSTEKEGFHTNCLLGWPEYVVPYNAVTYYLNFFTFFHNNYMTTKKPLPIKEAKDYASSCFPYMKPNHRGDLLQQVP